MSKNAHIIWLTSYPKSGNTWFRVFLSNLLNPTNTPANINELIETPIASSRSTFDSLTGLNSSDMAPADIEAARPDVYRYYSKKATDNLYMKVHDAYTLTKYNEPIFPESVSKGVLYFIRNPLDVAVSFAHHSSCSINKMIDCMNSSNFIFLKNTASLKNQLTQKLLNWSEHEQSWTQQNEIPILVTRYEDMINNPLNAFALMVEFAGINASEKQIATAIENSSFQNLKKQEKISGFKEKSPDAPTFFRKGIVGDWKNTLSLKQIEKITTKHRDVMIKYQYLTPQGEIIKE